MLFNLDKTSTTSIIACLIVIVGFTLLFCLSFIPTDIDNALKTQIVQGDWQIITLAALYYFGQSKARKDPNTPPIEDVK